MFRVRCMYADECINMFNYWVLDAPFQYCVLVRVSLNVIYLMHSTCSYTPAIYYELLLFFHSEAKSASAWHGIGMSLKTNNNNCLYVQEMKKKKNGK